jgi:hypothetical protein
VTAGEDQLQPLVRECRLLHGVPRGRVLLGVGDLEQARLRRQGAIAPDAVDRAAASRRDQPPCRARRRTFSGPALGRDREGLLRGLLGEVEVAEEADERSEDAPPVLAEGLLERQ